jgi:RNase P/RNase MRP subunit p30
LRGSRGHSSAQACDLLVMLPKSTSSKLKKQLLIKEIQQRLQDTGYTKMAITHTIYGRPSNEADKVDIAIPTSLWNIIPKKEKDNDGSNNDTAPAASATPNNKKRKLDNTTGSTTSSVSLSTSSKANTIHVLRRIHAVVENLTDVGIYSSNGGSYSQLLQEYDIVSICPTNDVTFQSACSNSSLADIVTLDYTLRGGLKLPYRIKSADVKAVVNRGAVFEIPLSPALLNLKYRKGLIQTCRELQSASIGLSKQLQVIISSGDRTLEGTDVGSLALRTPGDVINLCQTIMQFDSSVASKMVTDFPLHVIQRIEQRRYGIKTQIVNTVGFMTKNELLLNSSTTTIKKKDRKDGQEEEVDEDNDEDDIEVNEDNNDEKVDIHDEKSENDKSNDDEDEDDHDEGFIAM